MTSSLNTKGFTYLTALFLVMVMSVMLGVVGQSWKTIMQRELEEELLFRGMQYKDAITRWYKPLPGKTVRPPLQDLKDLLDTHSLTNERFLRRLYTDPITGKGWSVVADPNKGISGVFSPSTDKPIKTGGFPDDLSSFAGKETYADWKFIYNSGYTKNTVPVKTGQMDGTKK